MCVHVNIHPPMSKTRIPASVQSVHVKFNHYKKTDSCRGQRSGQVIFNLYRKSKVGGKCTDSQTGAKKLNSITIKTSILQGSKVGSGQIQSNRPALQFGGHLTKMIMMI